MDDPRGPSVIARTQLFRGVVPGKLKQGRIANKW